MLQKEAPLSDGCRRTLPEVVFEQLLRSLVCLGRPPTALSRLERRSPVGDPHVALDRGEAYTEQASSAGFGRAFLGCFYDPHTQILCNRASYPHDLLHGLSRSTIMRFAVQGPV